MTELLEYAYCKLERHECWHRWSVRRALIRLGAVQLGRSPTGRGRPGIWSLAAESMQHARNMQ
jgi:hypothetical protein